MDSLLHPALTNYVEQHTEALPPALDEVARFTEAHHPHAHLMSSRMQGQFLRQISLLLAPRYVLEVGTFTGFSALCLAAGLQATGELHTIECRPADAETAQGFFQQSAHAQQIVSHVGLAASIIPTLTPCWDLAFLDADKTGYIDYYELILPQMRAGGLLMADNVLFHGQVLSDSPSSKHARAIHAFNQHVANDPRVEQVLLPLRDGLLLIRKKG